MHGGEIFVPKIPSMNIVDLARAIAPECRLDVVGVRPGEKLHETMVPEDDARNTVEYDDCFVIRSPTANGQVNANGGKSLSPGFHYSSDNNPRWLSVDELQRLVNCSWLIEQGVFLWRLTAVRRCVRKCCPTAIKASIESDIAAVADALRSDWLTTGPRVTRIRARLRRVGAAPAKRWR